MTTTAPHKNRRACASHLASFACYCIIWVEIEGMSPAVFYEINNGELVQTEQSYFIVMMDLLAHWLCRVFRIFVDIAFVIAQD